MLHPARTTVARPSAPLVISIIALIMSLTGTAFAAGVLPANSVGNKQVVAGAITAPKIRTWAITAPKIKSNAVSSSKVADGSLLAADFQAGQLPPVQAYAQVTGGVTPAFTASTTRNFTGVVHSGLGTYCITPAAGISSATRPAVVSVQSAQDEPLLATGQFVFWEAAATGCATGDYKVRTYRIYTEAMGGPALADDVSFSIIVA